MFDIKNMPRDNTNNNYGYIPGKLGFVDYKNNLIDNSYLGNFSFDSSFFLTRLLLEQDKKGYVHNFSDRVLSVAYDSLMSYRRLHPADMYTKRIDEALLLVESEISERRSFGILQAGKRAEREMRFALKHLSLENYIVFPLEDNESLVLESQSSGLQHEYDSIVISRYGVFIVECKNFKGELIRNSNGVWLRKKDGKTEIIDKNPLIQVDYQRRLLESILRENNAYAYVSAVICINNPSASISIVGDLKYPVVTLENLLDTLESLQHEDDLLTDEEMENVFDIINRSRAYDDVEMEDM